MYVETVCTPKSKIIPTFLLLVVIAGFVLFAGCVTQPHALSIPTATMTPVPSDSGLTNQNSPEAATYTPYPSQTKQHTPEVPVGLTYVAGGFTAPIPLPIHLTGAGGSFWLTRPGT